MKNIIHFILFLLLSSSVLWAQSIPQGMRYQAVARDADGNVIENQRISLKISLKTGDHGDAIYQESHHVTTNQLGLFSITIGEGKPLYGEFATIPWSVAQIWLDIEMDETGGNKFLHINSSQLLAVPYAFHAGTAGSVMDQDQGDQKNGGLQFYWSINGNIGTFPNLHYIGTRDYKDFNFRTNDLNRLTISKDGELDIAGDLNVGNNLVVNNNLMVGNDVEIGQDLRVERDLSVGNDGLIENDFRIENDLSVGNNTTLEGELTVEDNALFNEQVVLDNAGLSSSSSSTGALVVVGGVGIGQNLNVESTINSAGLNVNGSSTSFVATFTNTNTGGGDGIAIKLGRNHPLWNGSAFHSVEVPWVSQLNTQINTIKNWVTGTPFQPTDLLSLFPASIQAGMALTVVNVVTQELNDILNLPISIGPYQFPRVCVDLGVDDFCIGPFEIVPEFTILPEIPQIPISTLGLPTFNIPSMSFTNVTNSLTNQNEYIKFLDQGDRQVGSIRAQSIENWELSFLDGVFFVNVLADLVGIDFVSGAVGLIKGFTNVTDTYNKIGVEFVSGHGDYAEWLPRINEEEFISAGDIVAIKGGKITKDLSGAEQILAVSQKPIILGNAPEKGKEHLGNKVAFLGQIPVKILGPVSSGDYIIAKGDVPGYGIAVQAEELSLEDLPFIIGRSWENHLSHGPKMINTIIGLNKNDVAHILTKELKKIDELTKELKKLDDLETRFSALEKTFELLNKREQTQMSYHSKVNTIGK